MSHHSYLCGFNLYETKNDTVGLNVLKSPGSGFRVVENEGVI
jgi:hypothetical protein